MKTTTKAMRRRLYSVFAAAAAGGAAVAGLSLLAGPSATAAPDPCAASEVARTVGSVATSTGSYLDSHPQTNQALTTISQQQAGPQSLAALKNYFDANPQAGKDMQQLQAAARQSVHPVQAADHRPAVDGTHAGRTGAGRRAAVHFAGRAAGGTERRRAQRGAARAVVPGIGVDAGQRSAAGSVDDRHPLAVRHSRDVAGEVLGCGFGTSPDWFTAREESRHRF